MFVSPSRFHQKIGLLLTLLLIFTGSFTLTAQSEVTSVDDVSVATDWFTLQLDLVRETPGFSPPVASRAFGYTGVALYESVIADIPDYQSLAGQLNELEALPTLGEGEPYHRAAAANAALAHITRQLFPNASEENQAAIDALYDELAAQYESEVDSTTYRNSVRYGQEIADLIFEWSKTDGGHEGYTRNFPDDFYPPTGPGMWVPTPRLDGGDPQPAMQPNWGYNRPFVLNNGTACMPGAPPVYSEEPGSAFYEEAMEVYDVTQQLTDEQLEIALFWADDPGVTSTPPGHSISILTQILVDQDASLVFAAQAYAKMGIAVSDAFIGCWRAKYVYNLVRPITYIQRLIDADWSSPVNTPPFPEYPSGHSTQSGAAQAVFEGLFGTSYRFTDTTHERIGMEARSFTSFAEAAEEAAMSRLYGGIHYRAAIELGLDQGRCIGEQVNKLRFVSGT